MEALPAARFPEPTRAEQRPAPRPAECPTCIFRHAWPDCSPYATQRECHDAKVADCEACLNWHDGACGEGKTPKTCFSYNYEPDACPQCGEQVSHKTWTCTCGYDRNGRG